MTLAHHTLCTSYRSVSLLETQHVSLRLYSALMPRLSMTTYVYDRRRIGKQFVRCPVSTASVYPTSAIYVYFMTNSRLTKVRVLMVNL